MDFGEILKLWEGDERRKAARGGGPDPAKPRPSPESKAAEAQAAWLARYGTPELSEREEAEHAPRLSRKDLDSIPFDSRIDLHGMTAKEAEAALDAFLRTAELSGYRKVLIVHGKGLHSSGEPVLAGTVRRGLERRKSVGRFGKASKEDGGEGATWAMLKGTRDQRSR